MFWGLSLGRGSLVRDREIRMGWGRFGLSGQTVGHFPFCWSPRDNGLFRVVSGLEQWEQKPGRKQRKGLRESWQDREWGVG